MNTSQLLAVLTAILMNNRRSDVPAARELAIEIVGQYIDGPCASPIYLPADEGDPQTCTLCSWPVKVHK